MRDRHTYKTKQKKTKKKQKKKLVPFMGVFLGVKRALRIKTSRIACAKESGVGDQKG